MKNRKSLTCLIAVTLMCACHGQSSATFSSPNSVSSETPSSSIVSSESSVTSISSSSSSATSSATTSSSSSIASSSSSASSNQSSSSSSSSAPYVPAAADFGPLLYENGFIGPSGALWIDLEETTFTDWEYYRKRGSRYLSSDYYYAPKLNNKEGVSVAKGIFAEILLQTPSAVTSIRP